MFLKRFLNYLILLRFFEKRVKKLKIMIKENCNDNIYWDIEEDIGKVYIKWEEEL